MVGHVVDHEVVLVVVDMDQVAREAVGVLLEEGGLNHHLVYDLSNYHIFAKQIFLGHLSRICVEFYYRVEYGDACPLVGVDQLLQHCHAVHPNVHFVSLISGSL